MIKLIAHRPRPSLQEAISCEAPHRINCAAIRQRTYTSALGLTQTVPALKPLDMVVAMLRLLVNTPAAKPYSVSFARSCMHPKPHPCQHVYFTCHKATLPVEPDMLYAL